MRRRVSFARAGSGVNSFTSVNFTPLIDITCTLLFVFIISMPAVLSGLNIELPKGVKSEEQIIENATFPITIACKEEGVLYINDNKVDMKKLVPSLKRIAKSKDKIFLLGDKNIKYGYVMYLMSILQKAGFSNTILVTEQED